MARFAFCGATYTSQSVNADAQLSMGWYPESDESGNGKSAVVMYPTPGSKVFCTLSGPTIRGEWTINGRMFVVSGPNLYEVFADGTFNLIGAVANDNLPVSITSSPQQMLIASAGIAYVLNLKTNALNGVPNINVYSIPFGSATYIIPYDSSTGIFNAGDVVTANHSGNTATIISGGATGPLVVGAPFTGTWPDTDILDVTWTDGTTGGVFTASGLPGNPNFNVGDIVTANNSGATATVVSGGTGAALLVGPPFTGTWPDVDPLDTSWTDDDGSVFAASGLPTLASSTPPFPEPVSQVDFCDGFFIVLIANSQQIFASSPLDANTWPGASAAIVSVFSDNVLAMKVNQRQIWLLGLKAGVVYYDSGAIPFPFDVVPGGFIEQGIIAMDSLVKLDNSLFWLGGDERGDLIAWRASGYTPIRVSNHAVENAWQNFATAADARAYSYQDRGHSFWVIYFPTANQTWVYDVATGNWHNRGFLTPAGMINAHHSQNHAFIFGKHLVGDWATGNIYDMNINYFDDAGTPIKRIRRAPHISTENQWMFHHNLELSLEAGVGPIPPLLDGNGVPRGPQVMLRWSDDGGHTWSNEQMASAGQAGEYLKRVIWRRLGRTRDRVYEISTTDSVAWRLIDAYLKADAGYKPQERLTDQLRKEG